MVSDTDGSAFITKAEFDSLKNNFQAQIDNYNSSIDSKIDGAIASYLSGIKLTTEEAMICPVDNYKDIVWINDWKLYGHRKHFSCTSINAVDYNNTNVWFVPPREERVVTRGQNAWFSSIGWSWGHIPMGVNGNFTFSGQPAICSDMGDRAEIFAVKLVSQDNQNVDISVPYVNVRGITNFYRAYGYSNGASDNEWGHQIAPTGKLSAYSDTDANKILSFATEIYCDSTSSKRTINHFLRTNNVAFPATYGYFDAFNDTTYNRTAITSLTSDVYGTLSTLKTNGGVTAVQVHPTYKTQLLDMTKFMMFGNDITTEVNTYTLVNNSDLLGGTQYVTDNSRTISGTYTITTVFGSAPNQNGATITTHSVDSVSGTTAHTITIPFMPKIQLRNLSSGQIKDSGLADLKYGQGIPIVKNLTRKGNIKLKITWDIPNILGTGAAVSDQSIKLDLKDTDFLSSTGNYIKGSIGAGGALTEIKDLQINNATKSAEIYINNANAGDNIWLRMKPNSTTDGICAKITDMQITWFNEN